MVHYIEHLEGVPLVALHGAGVDHREIEAAIESVFPGSRYRRIYPDLPGMGHSTAGGLTCNDDVVATARRYRDHVAPGMALVDEAALGRIFTGWTVDVGTATFAAPTLVVAGRHDSVAGFADAADLPNHYPRASLAILEEPATRSCTSGRNYSPRC